MPNAPRRGYYQRIDWPPGRIGLALACVLVGVALLLSARDAGRVQRANEQALAGDFPRAVDTASAVRAGPSRSAALLVEGQAATDLGNYPEAVTILRAARDATPDDWQVHFYFAQALLRDGRGAAARTEMRRAKRLDPLLYVPPEFIRGR